MVGYVEPNNTLSSIGSVFVIIGSYEGDGDDETDYTTIADIDGIYIFGDMRILRPSDRAYVEAEGWNVTNNCAYFPIENGEDDEGDEM